MIQTRSALMSWLGRQPVNLAGLAVIISICWLEKELYTSYPVGGFKTSRLGHLGLVAATFYFCGIIVITFPDGSRQITNMNEHHVMIIGLLGAAFGYHYS